jgi:hypothetical protein
MAYNIPIPYPLDEISDHLSVHVINLKAARQFETEFTLDWERLTHQIIKLEKAINGITVARCLDTD